MRDKQLNKEENTLQKKQLNKKETTKKKTSPRQRRKQSQPLHYL